MENLPVYKLVIDDNEELGVEFVALVDQPAIETNWHAFKDQQFETYNDYPKQASENAKIALRWAEENGWGDWLVLILIGSILSSRPVGSFGKKNSLTALTGYF